MFIGAHRGSMGALTTAARFAVLGNSLTRGGTGSPVNVSFDSD